MQKENTYYHLLAGNVTCWLEMFISQQSRMANTHNALSSSVCILYILLR